MNERASQPPIPEARPPHLPDTLTRLSPGFYLFGLAAVVIAWLHFRDWMGTFTVIDGGAVVALVARLQFVVAPLLGAALFLRHPGAYRTTPLLVFGLALLTFGEMLTALSAPIQRFLAGLSQPEDDFPSPATVAYGVFTSLVGLFAVLYMGAGLSVARRAERRPAERPLTVWLAALSFVSVVLTVAGIVQTPYELTPNLLISLVISVVLSAVLTLAWAYLTAVALGGWLAGDAPRRAWRLAAAGLVVLFVVRLLSTTLTAFAIPEVFALVLATITIVALVGWLLLLWAFLLGLPVASVDVADPTVDPPAATQPGSAAG